MLALSVLADGCERSQQAGGTGETDFLHACCGDCGDRLRCVDAACTRWCEQDDTCSSLASGAACQARAASTADAGASTNAICEVACNANGDCAALGAGFACQAARCCSRPAQSTEPDAAQASCDDGCNVTGERAPVGPSAGRLGVQLKARDGDDDDRR